jgi:hypothetical protein
VTARFSRRTLNLGSRYIHAIRTSVRVNEASDSVSGAKVKVKMTLRRDTIPLSLVASVKVNLL